MRVLLAAFAVLLSGCAANPQKSAECAQSGGYYNRYYNFVGKCMTLQTGSDLAPIVDTKREDFDRVKYGTDLTECREYAMSAPSNISGNAIAGALVGAAMGATVAGAYGGDVGSTAASTAAVGGVAGGIHGAAAAGNSQRAVMRNCMRGRGYSVLD